MQLLQQSNVSGTHLLTVHYCQSTNILTFNDVVCRTLKMKLLTNVCLALVIIKGKY